MSFLLTCPNCGKRPVGEFSFRGELLKRPSPADGFDDWSDYVYLKKNAMGKQVEWWYHGSGCLRWFLSERDTTNNTDHRSFWYGETRTPPSM